VFFALAIALAILIGGLACLHNRARRRRALVIATETGTQGQNLARKKSSKKFLPAPILSAIAIQQPDGTVSYAAPGTAQETAKVEEQPMKLLAREEPSVANMV
jgi:hypothetical protein